VILAGGLIRTLDAQIPTQRALAIAGELVAGGVGVHETALASPETVDLGGRVVVPGFTDSHVHFATWALAQTEVSLDGCTSLAEAVGRIRAGGLPGAGRWLRGYGWRSGDWTDGREPTRQDLDAVTGDVPAALIAKDYHSLWLNTAGLERAGGDLEVAGGVVERAPDGTPTGILREEAAWRFKARYITVPDDEYVTAMRVGMRLANSRGVTAVHDKDGWLGALRLWQQLGAGTLTLRVWQSIPHEQVASATELGVRSGFGDPMLALGYLKVFMDGTLGSQTAWLLDGSGVQITSGEELAEIVQLGAAAGLPVAVHAIGDRANREALDSFEQTRELWAPLGLRHRIEHAQLLTPEDIHRFANLGVAASVQFAHAPSDRHLADRYWGEKTAGAYAYRSLVDSGAVVANGSDAPIEELDPLAGIRAGVRRTIDEQPAWHPEQAVTVDQAFHATCVAPAWLAGAERRRGTLIPGRDADLVVLDRDPWDDLDAKVVATMVAGRWVHNPPPWD
jgi:predicted amidohydrolase YtcJ